MAPGSAQARNQHPSQGSISRSASLEEGIASTDDHSALVQAAVAAKHVRLPCTVSCRPGVSSVAISRTHARSLHTPSLPFGQQDALPPTAPPPLRAAAAVLRRSPKMGRLASTSCQWLRTATLQARQGTSPIACWIWRTSHDPCVSWWWTGALWTHDSCSGLQDRILIEVVAGRSRQRTRTIWIS